MDEATNVQGTVIGAGTLLVVGVLAYGTLVSTTLAGVETMTVAGWLFALTLGAVALLHAASGAYDLTLGFGGVGAGWVFVLLGTGAQIVLGLVVLALSGLYVVLVTRRHARDGTAASA